GHADLAGRWARRAIGADLRRDCEEEPHYDGHRFGIGTAAALPMPVHRRWRQADSAHLRQLSSEQMMRGWPSMSISRRPGRVLCAGLVTASTLLCASHAAVADAVLDVVIGSETRHFERDALLKRPDVAD